MDIIGYEGLYKIYDDGRVFSVRNNLFLKPSIDKQGYCHISLCNNAIKKYFRVHFLVASHYLGKKPVGYEIDHIDRDPLNNNLKNLRYISRSGNNKNKCVMGKIPHRHISKMGTGFQIMITTNKKILFNKASINWTLEEAVVVRNEAYKKLGIKIDDSLKRDIDPRIECKNYNNKYVWGKIPYRNIARFKTGFQVKIIKNKKIMFRKQSRIWTLEDAIKVRNDAYIKLGIEIDDAIRK